MNKRVPILLPIAGSALLAMAALADVAVEVTPTEATIAPRQALRTEIRLPPMAFSIAATLRCHGKPVSLTLSVADVHHTVPGEQLRAEDVVKTEISVPSQQLALVLAGSSFCLVGEPADANPLFVPAVGTAHASLQCSSDTGTTVHYASAPLPLKLLCAGQPDQVPEVPAPR